MQRTLLRASLILCERRESESRLKLSSSVNVTRSHRRHMLTATAQGRDAGGGDAVRAVRRALRRITATDNKTSPLRWSPSGIHVNTRVEGRKRREGTRSCGCVALAPANLLVCATVLDAQHCQDGAAAEGLLLQEATRGEWGALACYGVVAHTPHLAVLRDKPAAVCVRAVPHVLLGPCWVREDISAVKGINRNIIVQLPLRAREYFIPVPV